MYCRHYCSCDFVCKYMRVGRLFVDFVIPNTYYFVCFRHDDSTWLYGVFDGHDGKAVAEYTAQKIPAELMFGQLDGKQTDEEVNKQCCYFDEAIISFIVCISRTLNIQGRSRTQAARKSRRATGEDLYPFKNWFAAFAT